MQRLNVSEVIKYCFQKCPVDPEELKLFELSTDLNHLPNSYLLKCYIHCTMEETGAIKRNSTKINVGQMMDTINQLPKEQQDILFAMGRGCVRRIMNIKDPLQYAYILNVCAKENDNEVRECSLFLPVWVHEGVKYVKYKLINKKHI